MVMASSAGPTAPFPSPSALLPPWFFLQLCAFGFAAMLKIAGTLAANRKIDNLRRQRSRFVLAIWPTRPAVFLYKQGFGEQEEVKTPANQSLG
jgi:hypothetical protein